MPISNKTTDYTGRTLDIFIFKGVNPDGSAAVAPSFGPTSQYCTGIEKLVQRFGIALLTVVGSQTAFPSFGTSLLTKLSSGNFVYNIADVYPIVNFAIANVIASFRNYQRTANPAPPGDEQLNTALLTSVSVQDTTLNLGITIYPMQTSAVNFVFPLPLTQ